MTFIFQSITPMTPCLFHLLPEWPPIFGKVRFTWKAPTLKIVEAHPRHFEYGVPPGLYYSTTQFITNNYTCQQSLPIVSQPV